MGIARCPERTDFLPRTGQKRVFSGFLACLPDGLEDISWQTKRFFHLPWVRRTDVQMEGRWPEEPTYH